MNINKSDLVFYLSVLASVGALIVKLASPIITGPTLSWVSLVSSVVGLVAYETYEYFNGTLPPPTSPTVPTPPQP
jgi:hypothetical protein